MNKTLRGLRDASLAENLYYLEKAGMTLKQVKITLNNYAVTTEREPCTSTKVISLLNVKQEE